MRAYIYARYSPREGHETSQSNMTQTEACRKWCAEQNIEIGGEHEDQGKSGMDEDRPGLWAAVDALKRGDLLVCYRLDRLSKKTQLSVKLEEIIGKKRARFVSIADEGTWNDTPEDALMRKMLTAFAEYNTLIMRIRTSHAMRRHQASGRSMSSKPPYGYAIVPGAGPDDPNRLREVPGEMEIISQIIAAHDEGMSLRGTAQALEARGVKCRGRDRWHHGLIRAVLVRAGAIEEKGKGG